MTVECLQGDTTLTRPTTPSSPVTAHPAFAGAIEAIAASIVDALAEPLRAEIEAKIQQLVADAAQDIHARIVTAVGQIQPINIPINLLAQPVVQMAVPPVAQQPAVVPVVASSPVAMVREVEVSTPAELPELAVVEPVVMASSEPVAVPTPVPIPAEGTTVFTTPESALPVLDAAKKRPKSKNMGVTVVGLLPGQAHMIKNEFRFIKLTFVQADARNSNQLTALSKGDNTVIFMTDFIRHASVEAVRAVHGNWVYVTGGMTSLRDKLRELHQAHQQKADWL